MRVASARSHSATGRNASRASAASTHSLSSGRNLAPEAPSKEMASGEQGFIGETVGSAGGVIVGTVWSVSMGSREEGWCSSTVTVAPPAVSTPFQMSVSRLMPRGENGCCGAAVAPTDWRITSACSNLSPKVTSWPVSFREAVMLSASLLRISSRVMLSGPWVSRPHSMQTRVGRLIPSEFACLIATVKAS